MQEIAPEQPDATSALQHYETGLPSLRRTCGLALGLLEQIAYLEPIYNCARGFRQKFRLAYIVMVRHHDRSELLVGACCSVEHGFANDR